LLLGVLLLTLFKVWTIFCYNSRFKKIKRLWFTGCSM